MSMTKSLTFIISITFAAGTASSPPQLMGITDRPEHQISQWEVVLGWRFLKELPLWESVFYDHYYLKTDDHM